MRHSRITLLAVAVLLGAANHASAALFPYTFQKIAETPGQFSDFSGAALNNDGRVSFYATPTGGTRGIYQGRPGDIQPVTFPGFDEVSTTQFSRNSAGDYAVYGTRTGQTAPGIYRVVPGPVIGEAITTIAEPSSLAFPLIAGPVISDSGHVTFATGDMQFQRVYVGNGTAAPTQTQFSSGTLQLLKISPDGRPLTHVTAPVFANTLSLDGQPIVTQNQGYIIKGVADVAGNNRVVFPAMGQGTPDELFVWQNGAITPVPDSALLGDFIYTAINDAGVVAALATPTGGAERLMLFKDGVRQTVLTVGDPLFDSTITDLGFGDINNNEQLTFSATLADGRQVTVFAAPVPEPAAAGLLALGAGIALRRRR